MSNTKTKTYTTTELASICSVSVASISSYIKKHKLKQVKTGNYNAKYYDEGVLQQLKDHYNSKPKPNLNHQQTTKDDVIEQLQARIKEQSSTIELLKEQLNVKDDQIGNMQKLMDQNQQLLLNTQSENKHLLALTHDGKTDESQVQDGEYKETETDRKQETETTENSSNASNSNDSKPWWKRIF